MILDKDDLIKLLAIVVALAAYTGTIRRRMFDERKKAKKSNDKDFLKGYIQAVGVGDIFLILSVILFCISLYLKFLQDPQSTTSQVFLQKTANDWDILAVPMFMAGLFWLILLHAYEWHRTFFDGKTIWIKIIRKRIFLINTRKHIREPHTFWKHLFQVILTWFIVIIMGFLLFLIGHYLLMIIQ